MKLPACLEFKDENAGLVAYVAIDSLINNRSCGGLRMIPGVTPGEMAGLASAMTLKYGFLGLPHGGAKAGIVCDEGADDETKRRLLEAFAIKAGSLLRTRVYAPGADMGTTNSMIKEMLGRADVSVPKRALKSEDSGFYTAETVLSAFKAAASAIGLALKGSTAAIEGFGSVGMPLAVGLDALGVRVVAVSTSKGAIYDPKGLDVKKLVEAGQRHSSRFVEHYDNAKKIELGALLELPIDSLFPCARHASINAKNAGDVKARIICPGANNPVTDEAEDILFKRGVLSVPDFVANSGGVLGGTMEFAGIERDAIRGFISRYFSAEVNDILKGASGSNTTPREVALKLSMERFRRMENEARNSSPRSRLFAVAHDLYRRGLIPGFIVRKRAHEYFAKRITGRF